MTQAAQDFKRWKACGRKKRYATEQEAKDIAAKYQQQHYRCKFCAGFHLTNSIAKTITTIRSKGRKIL